MKKIKKSKLVVIVLVLLLAVLAGGLFVRDRLRLASAVKKVDWIENFYTINSRYPFRTEIERQFPRLKSWQYRSLGLNSIEGNPAQTFSFRYRLLRRNSRAVGSPEMDMFGYEGKYVVNPCLRWDKFGLGKSEVITYVYPPGGLIYSDLYGGEIYFIAKQKKDEKVTLLSGLKNPRLFQRSNIDKTLNIVVTDGNDVISYDWGGDEIKLINPEKIGEVPTSCPSY